MCLSSIRNIYRKMPSHVFENHPLNNGGGYEVLTYLRQSWIQTPPSPSRTAFPRKVTSSRPLEIDVDRPAERIEKISRACLFVPREPTNSAAVFPTLKVSLFLDFSRTHTHTRTPVKMRAQTWSGTYPRSDFSSDSTGVGCSYIERECIGEIPQIGETLKWMY